MGKSTKDSPDSASETVDPPASGRGSRRDHIVALAAQLFAEKGVASTTVRDIGSAAGILSGSLYYHFDSKESIVKEILRDYLSRIIESYEVVTAENDDPRSCLEGLIRVSLEAIERERHACEIYHNDYTTLHALQDFPELDVLTTRVQKVWMDTIDRGVESGAFRDDIDPKVFYRLTRDATWLTVRWNRPQFDAASHSRTIAAIMLDGFGAA
ncbi:MAG: putative transcriptional regulator TetR family protein [Acidimicrobiales bacterium]|nr:MAG: putative transcriptional regulator TetR family protein [Acidimicrobiales bacterium]